MMTSSTTTQVSLFSILVISLVSIPNFVLPYQTVVVNQLPSYSRIELTSVLGPESLAFDPANLGPYTGVSDGRILKWNGHARGWMEFAVPPRHSSVRRDMCVGTANTSMEDKCGRPLGLQFHKATGDLYIADAYFGLLKVGRRGGVATKLATAAEGVPFRLTNGVDVDQQSGMVYFTDSSTQFQRREWILSVVTHDSTGRFMSYNPKTKEVKVLIRNLEFPNGVSLSNDGSFVLVGESTKQRVLRYWLRGPKATTFEVFANVTGYPDNIKRNPQGDFWVAINFGNGSVVHGIEGEGGDRIVQSQAGEEVTEDMKAIRFGKNGDVLEVLDDNTVNPVSEVVENMGTLWFGSVVAPFIGLCKPLNL